MRARTVEQKACKLSSFSISGRSGQYKGLGVLPSSLKYGHLIAQETQKPGGVGSDNGFLDIIAWDVLASVLEMCGRRKQLTEGKEIHGFMVQQGFDLNPLSVNLVLNFYTKCVSIADAQHFFDTMPVHDAYAWTMIISARAIPGHAHEALRLFWQMETEGVQIDRVSCLAILKACAVEGALDQGKQIHSFLFTSGINMSETAGNSLIDMYTKCGSIDDAWQVFDTMPDRNAISWNIMIAGFARLGRTEEAFTFFKSMEKEGLEPDEVTFLSILKACKRVEQAKFVENYMLRNNIKLTDFIGNTLIDMYIKQESLASAWKVFDKMHDRGTLTWTMVITGHAKYDLMDECFTLFAGMSQEGMLPNPLTFVSILNSCSDVRLGKHIHAQYLANHYPSNTKVGNALINMYARCGSLQHSHTAFNEILDRDIVSWNSLMSAYVGCDYGDEALTLFWEMGTEQLEPDTASYLSVLKSCSILGVTDCGLLVHAYLVEKNLDIDFYLESAMVDMYSKCGAIADARHLFDKMQQYDVVSWNTIMAAYVQNGHSEEAFHFFAHMEEKELDPDASTFLTLLKACSNTGNSDQGKIIHGCAVESAAHSNTFVSASLIDLYAKSGCTEDACVVFDSMAERDVVAWNAMIVGNAEHEHFEEALHLFEKMKQEKVTADAVTCVGALKASASLAAIEKGQEIHDVIFKLGLENNVYAGSILVDMYGKCGNAEDAQAVFNKILERDVATWNAMIGGYALIGRFDEALETYEQMQSEGVTVVFITLVNVLSACIHAGHVITGYEYFKLAKDEMFSMMTVDHCSCVVDLFGRAGLVQEGLCLIESMPIQPNTVVWTALLSVCKVVGDVRLGLVAAECILELDPNDNITLLQLCVLYYQME